MSMIRVFVVACMLLSAGCKSSLTKFHEATEIPESQVQVIAVKSRCESRLVSLRVKYPAKQSVDDARVTSVRAKYQDAKAELDAYLELLQQKIISGADFSKAAVRKPFLDQRDVVAKAGAEFLQAADKALGEPTVRLAPALVEGIIVGLARGGIEVYKAWEASERRDREALVKQIDKQRMRPFEKVKP